MVPNNYIFGNRKSQIMHVRLRLQCSSLGSDLYKNHFSDSDLCTDCNVPETAKHYLFHYKRYNNVRAQSISAINVAVDIDILLKGCPMYDDITNRYIFLAVQEYIRLTERFWLGQCLSTPSSFRPNPLHIPNLYPVTLPQIDVSINFFNLIS